jgi:hypothetical protein
MKIFKCDRCGKTASPKKADEDYIENWESVTISSVFHYDICDGCAPELFQFFEIFQLAASS